MSFRTSGASPGGGVRLGFVLAAAVGGIEHARLLFLATTQLAALAALASPVSSAPDAAARVRSTGKDRPLLLKVKRNGRSVFVAVERGNGS